MTLATALLAGVVSFASPCVLPIVPGFLSVITGLDVTASDRRRGQTARILVHTSLFILGFSVVFVLLGLTATTIGSAIFRNQILLTKVSGVLLVAMSIYLFSSMVATNPRLFQDKRRHPSLGRFGPFAAPVAGAAFGFGWTPCIGPILTSVLAVAATRGRASEGVALLGAYSLGLGIPFLATGLAFGRLAGVFKWFKRHVRAVTFATAGSMALFGSLLILDRLAWVTTRLQIFFGAIGLEELIFLG